MNDFPCPKCKVPNGVDSDSCSNCGASLIFGKLTSLGTGVLPKGFVYELRPTAIQMGRNIANDFVVPSNLIAPDQARFTYHHTGYVIEDIEGQSRCLVNGEVVSHPETIPDNANIRVGVEEFQYRFLGETPAGQTKSDPIAAHLQLTLGIISEFHASLNLQEVFDNALDAVIRLTRTERAYAFLVATDDEGNPDLQEVARRRAGGRNLEDDVESSGGYSISQSAIEKVFSGDGSVIIEDAGEQQIQTETMMRFRLQTVVCLPLLTYDHRTGRKHVMGMIYADSNSLTGALPAHSRPTLQILTQIVTATVVKWRSYTRMQETFRKHERAAGTVDHDLTTISEALRDLDERVSRSGISRLTVGDVRLELDAVASRIETVRADLRKLGRTDSVD